MQLYLTNPQSNIGMSSSTTYSTSPRPYTFIVDTGSSDTWVMSTDCTSCMEEYPSDIEGNDLVYYDINEAGIELDDDMESVQVMYGDGSSFEGYPVEDNA